MAEFPNTLFEQIRFLKDYFVQVKGGTREFEHIWCFYAAKIMKYKEDPPSGLTTKN